MELYTKQWCTVWSNKQKSNKSAATCKNLILKNKREAATGDKAFTSKAQNSNKHNISKYDELKYEIIYMKYDC